MLPSPAMMICNISRVPNFYFPAFLIIVNVDIRNPSLQLCLFRLYPRDPEQCHHPDKPGCHGDCPKQALAHP